MKLHPQKCKVLSVIYHNEQIAVLPFDRFVYCLDNVCLDFVNSENDLGVHITTKLKWKEHIFIYVPK